jgi:hypothetical protein
MRTAKRNVFAASSWLSNVNSIDWMATRRMGRSWAISSEALPVLMPGMTSLDVTTKFGGTKPQHGANAGHAWTP